MAVMVTGTGFSGSYIVRDLIDAGEDVVVFGFFGGSGDPNDLDLPDLEFIDYLLGGGLRDKVRVVVGDVTDLAAIEAAVEAHDVRSIVHMAAKITGPATADPASAIRVNGGGVANIFEAAARHKLDKVVWASSIAVFGPKSVGPSGFVTDDSPLDPDGVYGATKVLGEALARRYWDVAGVDITGLRLSRVYGFGEHIKLPRGGGSSWLMRLLHDPAVGIGPAVVPHGDSSLDFHYVEDVSSAFVKALQFRGGGGESYLLSGDYRPIADAFDYVHDLLPEADMRLERGDASMQNAASTGWARRHDSSRAAAAFGARSRYSMEAGVYRTLNGYRIFSGNAEIPEPANARVDEG